MIAAIHGPRMLRALAAIGRALLIMLGAVTGYVWFVP